jgi:hypothetical protein
LQGINDHAPGTRDWRFTLSDAAANVLKKRIPGTSCQATIRKRSVAWLAILEQSHGYCVLTAAEQGRRSLLVTST